LDADLAAQSTHAWNQSFYSSFMAHFSDAAYKKAWLGDESSGTLLGSRGSTKSGSSA
jgi:hypothetical protein